MTVTQTRGAYIWLQADTDTQQTGGGTDLEG